MDSPRASGFGALGLVVPVTGLWPLGPFTFRKNAWRMPRRLRMVAALTSAAVQSQGFGKESQDANYVLVAGSMPVGFSVAEDISTECMGHGAQLHIAELFQGGNGCIEREVTVFAVHPAADFHLVPFAADVLQAFHNDLSIETELLE